MSLGRLIGGVSALAATAVAAGTLAATANSTTEPVRVYPVNVTLTEKAVRMNRHAIPFQSAAQFRIHNTTRAKRTFAIGGVRVVVRANGARIFLVIFDTRGKFPYVSTGRKGTPPLRGVVRVI